MLSNNKAKSYMKEWMNLTTISSFMNTGYFLFCTAIDSQGVRNEYKLEKYSDSENQYNVYTRKINSEGNWEWVDAISKEEEDK